MAAYTFYNPDRLKPAGWLKNQLKIQAEGLAGNLDKVWPDVRDSSWIGGDREGWERVPYWLDGFIPLAYLLADDDMIARAKKYIDAILVRQQADGWICPCTEEERPQYDTWATILISKVLTVYYENSGDERIPEVLYRTMKNYYTLLNDGTIRLFNWGKARWFEAFIALEFLSKRYHEDWIPALAKLLKAQGTDYNTLTELWKRPLNKWTYETHVVNLAMMLKFECVSCDLLGEEYTDQAEKLWDLLMEYNGTAAGIFTGDECLSGISPIQGTELCAVVELMYCFEKLYAYTGDPKWAERLEKIAFNALPATISDDMWSHQYDQMANQIACITFPGKPVFRTNHQDSHLFGLEPNFGCCTANHGQGWPKLALSAFMHDGNRIVSAVQVPSVLRADEADIELDTDYPFENRLTYRIAAKQDFTFAVRLPLGAENVRFSGHAASAEGFGIRAGETFELVVTFDTEAKLEKRPHGMYTLTKGALVYALPIQYHTKMLEYEKDGVERKFPYCDYELIPESEWRYAFDREQQFASQYFGVPAVPFASDAPALKIPVRVRRICWELADGYEDVAAAYPDHAASEADAETIEFIPYGCAKLRMTELPAAD